MDNTRPIAEIKAELHRLTGGLTLLAQEARPADAHEHQLRLDRRVILLQSVIQAVQDLSAAHTQAGAPWAAAALTEAREHFTFDLSLTRRDIRLHENGNSR